MKNKNLTFIVLGVLLVAGAAVFVAFSMNFLLKKIDSALTVENDNGSLVPRIDFDGLKKVGIIKE
ncbi:MAG: hypothetical protein AAB496_01975 [Patescibacteria group bacterium]